MTEGKPGLGYMLWLWRACEHAPTEDELREHGASDVELAVFSGRVPR